MGVDVVVVGGGITGLVAAHRLAMAGADVVQVEQSGRWGGMVATDIDDGFLIESGPDSFVAGKGSVLDLATELGLGPRVISARPGSKGTFVWWEGALHPLPGGMTSMVPATAPALFGSTLLSWRGKTRLLGDLVIPRSRDDSEESLESFVTRRLGREYLDRVAAPLIGGIHGAEPGSMSLQAAFPRLLEMEREHRSLILAARSMEADQATQSHFASFEHGMGELVTALVGATAGIDRRVGVRVESLKSDGSGFAVGLGDGSRLKTRALVLAVPSTAAASLLAPLAPAAAEALGGIAQTPTAGVTLAYPADRLPPLEGSGFVVPAVQGRPVSGVSFLSRKWEGRVPDPSYELIRVFVKGRHDRLVETAVEELRGMLGIEVEPVRSWVRVWPAGLHRYTLGHLDRVARAEAALFEIGGVTLAGAALHGVGLNACVDSGTRAAETVLSAIGSTAAPVSMGAGD